MKDNFSILEEGSSEEFKWGKRFKLDSETDVLRWATTEQTQVWPGSRAHKNMPRYATSQLTLLIVSYMSSAQYLFRICQVRHC